MARELPHLPDIPNAGYSSQKQRGLSDAMMESIRGLERDRLLLLEIVIGGRDLWRKHFLNAYRFMKADTECADAVFGYLVLLAGPNPEAQKAILEGLQRQQVQERWDKRMSTVLRHAKDRRQLEADIRADEARLKRRVTVS